MKKRLLCFSLVLVMLLTALLTGCSNNAENTEGGETESEVDNSAKTITMWLIEEDGMTEKAKEVVNARFTEITKSSFKTNVILRYCTENEYYTKLEKEIAAARKDEQDLEACRSALQAYIKANNKSGKDTPTLTAEFYEANPDFRKFSNLYDEEEEGPKEDQMVIGEDGVAEVKYPDVRDHQVDIFYLSGYDKYSEYIQKEWLAVLDDELTSSSKKLNDYISAALLEGVKVDGSTYGIPNNLPIGEYTYMMIDRRIENLVDNKENFNTDYSFKNGSISSVLDISRYLSDIKNLNAANGKGPDDEGYIVPLASTFDECMKMLVWYWELSYTDISVYETFYDETTGREYVIYDKYEYTRDLTEEELETATGDNVNKEDGTITETAFTIKCSGIETYKINENGQYVDEKGNVLNYSYAKDTNGVRWYTDSTAEGDGETIHVDESDEAKTISNIYLVDENGNPVTKENDKRVKVSATVKSDTRGNPMPSYNYGYNEGSDFSIMGSMINDPSVYTRGGINLGFTSLFADKDYQQLYLTLKKYEFEGYFGEPKDDQHVAVNFVKGDARIKVESEKNGYYRDPETGREYYVVVAKYPESKAEELYDNMFAVYANSTNVTRAMEVITSINTNSELRNLLQYGIEGQHYELNADGTAKLLTERLRKGEKEKVGTYRMDIYKTGNCFVAHPQEKDGPDIWKYAMVQNGDSLVNPLLGFDFNVANENSDYPIDVTLIDYINESNKATYERILECETLEELEELMLTGDSQSEDATYANNALKNLYNTGNSNIKKLINSAYDPAEPMAGAQPDMLGNSPCTVYFMWLEECGYLASK